MPGARGLRVPQGRLQVKDQSGLPDGYFLKMDLCRWHPYVPPFGFRRCVTCGCDAATLKVDCVQAKCPPLDCPRERHVKEDPTQCCSVSQRIS